MKEFIDKLIERLEEEKQRLRKLRNNTVTLTDHEVCAIEEGAFNFCKKAVNQLAEEYKGGWIPCSERLPEYTDEYNVTVDVASEFGCYRTVKTLRFVRIEGKEPKWVIPQYEVYRVIAWCELPAPYTEGESR